VSPRASSSDPSAYQRLREHLAYLEMSAAAEHLADELDRGTREQASATQVLERLMAIEADATRARRLRGRLRFARYPIHKTLAEFDLDFQPSLDRTVLAELSTLRFVEERRNVILLGPPGVGKSHLAIALGIAATEAGYRTYFTSAADLVANLQSAHLEGTAHPISQSKATPRTRSVDAEQRISRIRWSRRKPQRHFRTCNQERVILDQSNVLASSFRRRFNTREARPSFISATPSDSWRL